MSAEIYGGITVDLNDGPVRTEYSRGFDGKERARLVIGTQGESIAITVSSSPAQTVADLEACIAELLAWKHRQEQSAALREVA